MKAMIEIAELWENGPDVPKAAPTTTPVNRPNGTAARNLNIASL